MLDIFEIAIDEGKKLGIDEGKKLGIDEGKKLGIDEGKALGILENRREMVSDALTERFGAVMPQIPDRVKALQNPDVLKMLHRQALKCQNLQEFEAALNQLLE